MNVLIIGLPESEKNILSKIIMQKIGCSFEDIVYLSIDNFLADYKDFSGLCDRFSASTNKWLKTAKESRLGQYLVVIETIPNISIKILSKEIPFDEIYTIRIHPSIALQRCFKRAIKNGDTSYESLSTLKMQDRFIKQCEDLLHEFSKEEMFFIGNEFSKEVKIFKWSKIQKKEFHWGDFKKRTKLFIFNKNKN